MKINAADDDDEDEDASSNSSDSLVFILLLSSVAIAERANKWHVKRMQWHLHTEMLVHENQFDSMYRMSLLSFNKLLQLLSPSLQLKEKYATISGAEPIQCELMLHCMIRFLSGGSFHDIRSVASISKASFYRILWHAIDAVNNCKELMFSLPSTLESISALRKGFQLISRDGVMQGCIGAIDGFLLKIIAPPAKQVGNVSSYYSGHYCTYGINVQAICDADCRFYFIALAAPGKTGDVKAISKTSVPCWLECLPPGYFIAGDCAYTITEHLIAPYSGFNRFLEDNDNFNFYLSQMRIRIEMAFGLMVTKWRILRAPLCVKLCNIPHLITAIARLHNFCICEREKIPIIDVMYRVNAASQLPHEPFVLGYIPSDAPIIASREGVSLLREHLKQRVASNNLIRPINSNTTKALEMRREALYSSTV